MAWYNDPYNIARTVATGGLSQLPNVIQKNPNTVNTVAAIGTGGVYPAAKDIYNTWQGNTGNTDPWGDARSILTGGFSTVPGAGRAATAVATGGLSEVPWGDIGSQIRSILGGGGGGGSGGGGIGDILGNGKAPTPGAQPGMSGSPTAPDYSSFDIPSAANAAWVNDTSQFDRSKSLATQAADTDLQSQRDAMNRRFAMLGNLDSGAQFNLDQQAVTANRGQLSNTLEGINQQQQNELDRRQEVVQGQQFQAAQQNKGLAASTYAADLSNNAATNAQTEQNWVDKTVGDLNAYTAGKQDPIEKILNTFGDLSGLGGIPGLKSAIPGLPKLGLAGTQVPQNQTWNDYLTGGDTQGGFSFA